jgi:hypothetical protein
MTRNDLAKSEPTVRLEPDGLHWLFNGRRRRTRDDDLVIHPDDLPSCRATDLQRALRKAADSGDFAGQVLVTETDEGYMNEDGAPVAPASFALEEGRLAIEIVHMSDEYEDDGPPPKLTKLVAPVLKRRRLDVLTWSPDPYWTSPPWLWRATLVGSTRGRSLEDLFSAGMDVVRLLDAAATGNLTRTSVADVVRGGHASALIGQPEGHWLDVKSQHYDLSSPAGRISLAQSVTRFANAEDGGIVIVGMSTKRIPGGEEIRGVAPLPLDRQMARRYQQAIDERVFPPLDGLTIERVAADGGMLILIDVPPNPKSSSRSSYTAPSSTVASRERSSASFGDAVKRRSPSRRR